MMRIQLGENEATTDDCLDVRNWANEMRNEYIHIPVILYEMQNNVIIRELRMSASTSK